jgi:hypothetical protein
LRGKRSEAAFAFVVLRSKELEYDSHEKCRVGNGHNWASALRVMPLASAFQGPVSQSGTKAFRYRTGSPYFGTGLVTASEFLFIPIPD